MNVLVATPLRKELNLLLEHLWAKSLHTQVVNLPKAKVVHSSRTEITLAAAGHGKVRFAVAAQYLIDALGPFDLLICAGAAGALSAELHPGDVVVSTCTIEHDYKLGFGGPSEPPKFDGDAELIAQMQAATTEPGAFRVLFGPVASGDEDVVTRTRADELHKATGALAVAWEGAGAANVCSFNNIRFLEIRAVADAADHAAADSYHLNLPCAMQNIGTVLESYFAETAK